MYSLSNRSKDTPHLSFPFNPDCAVGIYCGLKIHAIPPRRDFTVLVLDILMNMPAGQNRSNCAFRNGFLRLVTMPTAQSGLKGKDRCGVSLDQLDREYIK